MQPSLVASGNPWQGNCLIRSIMMSPAFTRKGRAMRELSRNPCVLQQHRLWGGGYTCIGVTEPWGIKKSWFIKCLYHAHPIVHRWGAHVHVHRVHGVFVAAMGCCKSSGRVCEPLFEMSWGLDARQSIRSARTNPPWDGAWFGQSIPTRLMQRQGCQAVRAAAVLEPL